MYFDAPHAKRIEYRVPDPSCNPYFAFAAMLMAGLDGIAKKTDPGDPLDTDIYALSPEEASNIRQVPGKLDDALDALEADNEFLTKGDVFTKDLIESWLDYKRSRELDVVKLAPHPIEFMLYYDV
jgi:glutamine synthetase